MDLKSEINKERVKMRRPQNVLYAPKKPALPEKLLLLLSLLSLLFLALCTG